MTGTVTADGASPNSTRPSGWVASFSPDRSLAAFERDGQLVVSPATGTDGDRRPPASLAGEPTWFPAWESPETVLVQFDPDAGDRRSPRATGTPPGPADLAVRCAADDGTCEVALPPGWGDRMRCPVYR